MFFVQELPPAFLHVFEDELPTNLKFQMSQGSEKSVIYKKHKKKLYGVRWFFGTSLFEGDVCTVFNYMGNGTFQLDVFNVKYDDGNNACTGFTSMRNGADNTSFIGWKFVSRCVTASTCDGGFVKVPPGHVIPPEVNITRPGNSDNRRRLIHGLRIFHIRDLLMLTYRAEGEFDVVLFDQGGGEKSYSPYAARFGAMVGISWDQFKIEVQPFHLYKYCHGIDILADYRSCTDRWSPSQYLTVSHEGNVWFLQLRKFGRRWKISAGWVRFSQLLRLSVGDVLVFDMNAPPLGFSLCVYRIAERY
ncbi:hypothetical protein POM88_051841 [Heracleum sosnowskyi]|uniref:TF-B3 domain-containing protein n=1 Tax=Heracleum sosnowskyi TaxID=360622 RepID=A0AAD8LY41_9APIA|nr:hypothetical protein POM88_051841 [Heracleum sosnowskyi]